MTSPYLIKIAPKALKQIQALAPKYQKLMIKLIEALAINPRPPGARKINGMSGLYSEEIEHLRLVYKIEDQEVWMLFIKG